jgi:hypothetical protein
MVSSDPGPIGFSGDISFDGKLPSGVVASFPGLPPEASCTSSANAYSCTLTGMNWPATGSGYAINVHADVPGNQSTCAVTNDVAIKDPLGAPKNTSQPDDTHSATANLPNCTPTQPGATSDLKINNKAAGPCKMTGTGAGSVWECIFDVAVTNDGPDLYNDTVRVHHDPVPATAKLHAYASTVVWTCNQAAPGEPAVCNTKAPVAVNGPPSTDKLTLRLIYHLPGGFSVCGVPTDAEIKYAVGPPKNTVWPDKDSATALIPCPLMGGPQTAGPQCPPGWQWTGSHCARRIVDFTPPTSTPPPTPAGDPRPTRPTPACPGGQVFSNGHCCPAGRTWVGGRCITQQATPNCTNGTRLIGGKCQCPPGTSWSERQRRCVAQQAACSGGRAWVGGQCRCPFGTSWTGSRCERRGQVKLDRPGLAGKNQRQGRGQIRFRPPPNLQGPVRRY